MINPFKIKPMKRILFSGISVLFCISMMAQNNVSLKMNLEKNKVYRFKSVSNQTITQTVNGNQQTVDTKVDYALSLKMIDVTPDFMVTEIHFDTLITNTNSMGKVTSISSANEGDIKSTEMADVMSCIMNRLSKNPLYVKMDYTGNPLEIVNLKMLAGVIMKDTSSIALNEQVAAAIKKQIANVVSENTLKTMVGMFTYFLPGKEVSTGENWNVNIQTNSGGMALDILTKYHLDGVSGNFANISAESNIKATENAEPIHQGGATITYNDISGMSKSSLVIDTRTGLVVEEKGKSHIIGNLGVSAPGVSMQIPMDINGESSVTGLN
jgi:hypothetical protein